jgi:ribosomal protein S2|uniref:Ribosomal protein S2 n=1 Tax=Didymosphenia geminata TaxID=1115533 RepID=A0A1L4BMC8_9STRA|nr:ribosomal protein S2 [Didymosphenia geminata]API83111.1 ribosomal protein S2 [Didymosphenia geminata]
MKIIKNYGKQIKLFKLNFIKSKVYNTTHKNQNIALEDIESRLKKAIYIIYLYHVNNKKIMFVGNPLHINESMSFILRESKHIFLPKSSWIAGTLTNQKSFISTLLKKNIKLNKLSKQIVLLEQKSDLIVIMDSTVDSLVVEESYISRVPTIVLNSSLNPFMSKASFKVPGNFIFSKQKLKNNFFYSLVLATLKRANNIKKNFFIREHLLTTVSKIKFSKRFNKQRQFSHSKNVTFKKKPF